MNKRQKVLLSHVHTLLDSWIAFPFPGTPPEHLELLVHVRDCVTAVLQPQYDCLTLTEFCYDKSKK